MRRAVEWEILARVPRIKMLKVPEAEFDFDVRGGLLETRATYHHLHRICRRAGLRKIGWHVLRHTFASHLAMRGVPMRGIQELLGHATIMMTTRYAHLSPDTRRDYVNLLDEKGNRRATEMPSSLNA